MEQPLLGSYHIEATIPEKSSFSGKGSGSKGRHLGVSESIKSSEKQAREG